MNLPAIADVYAAFEEVTLAARAHVSGRAGGLLVLYALANDAGAAVALGSNIAGAASLGVDPDAERLKLAIRNSVCDFSVNHLDEALRILKNEVRKKQPVSVGLVGDVGTWLAEMTARGVQPDLVARSVADRDLFVARGARVLGEGHGRQSEFHGVWWSVGESPMRWLPVLDALAVQTLAQENKQDASADAGENDRLRWLRGVPRYLLRAQEHYLTMTPAETERFVGLVDAWRDSAGVSASVRVDR